MNDTIMVTGGAGFIGSYVVRELLKRDYDVVVYDAFVQYLPPMNSLLSDYMAYRFDGIEDEVTFERGDTRDAGHLRRTIEDHRPSRILHLAALPIADLSNTHSEEAMTSIVGGTVNALEIIRDISFVERFVYVSSSMIYGDFVERPAPEDHPKRPKDVYGGTKYSGEIMTETFGRRYGIDYTVVRPSAVYGPFDANRRVTQIFVENALQGEPLVVYGGGEQRLDFTYVGDTARGLVRAAFDENAANETFNITYGRGYSLLELVEILDGLVPDLEVDVVEERDVFRPKRGALSIEKARRKIGYEPEVSLEEGMERYVSTYKELGLFDD